MAEEEKSETTEETKSSSYVDLTQNDVGGVLVKDIKREGEGDERPCTGDTVYVHYVGTLLDGTQFDSSRDRGEKFEFKIGKGQVIKGWDLGVASMRRGELAVLTCTSAYGYGEGGSPPKIPGGATLVFEIELFDWKGEDVSPDKDGSVLKSTLVSGAGWESPNDRATVHIHVTGKHEGRVFEDRDVTLVVGEGSEAGVVAGVEAALRKLKKDEQARITVTASQAYGSKGHTEFNIPPGAALTYDVTLTDFEKAKEAWEMDAGEKLQQAQLIKDKGTKFFKEGKYKMALNYYTKIVDFLDAEDRYEGDEMIARHTLLLAGHLNKAMCFLKLEDNLEAIHSCDKVLELEEHNEKALFRKGSAHVNMRDWPEAVRCFERVLQISTDNKAAHNQIRLAKTRIKEDEQRDKNLYKNMFAKFAQADTQKEEAIRRAAGDAMRDVTDWDNKLADGMLPLEKEAEAFGETTPEPKYKQTNGSVDKTGAEQSD